MNRRWSTYSTGSFFFTRVRRVIIILANNAKILGRQLYADMGPLLKSLFIKLASMLKSIRVEIAKHLTPLLQRQRILSDRKTNTNRTRDTSVEFKRLLRRLGVITAAKLGETIQETKQAVKYDMELSKREINVASEQVPLEVTVERSNLNQILAQQLRERIGIDCQALEIGSLQIENKRYYSNDFPMSPKIVTNRGCIMVKGRNFNLIQIIQRN